MTHHKPKPSRSDDTVVLGDKAWETLWTETMGERPSESRPDGPGWKTAIEVAKERKCQVSTASYHLRKLLSQGLMEKAAGRVGPTRTKTWFYRPIPQHATKRSRK